MDTPGHDDVRALTNALKEAAQAHHRWEEEHGPDENWEEWYAGYMATRLDAAGWHLVPVTTTRYARLP